MPVSCRTRVATPAFFLPFPLVPPFPILPAISPFCPPFPLLQPLSPFFPPSPFFPGSPLTSPLLSPFFPHLTIFPPSPHCLPLCARFIFPLPSSPSPLALSPASLFLPSICASPPSPSPSCPSLSHSPNLLSPSLPTFRRGVDLPSSPPALALPSSCMVSLLFTTISLLSPALPSFPCSPLFPPLSPLLSILSPALPSFPTLSPLSFPPLSTLHPALSLFPTLSPLSLFPTLSPLSLFPTLSLLSLSSPLSPLLPTLSFPCAPPISPLYAQPLLLPSLSPLHIVPYPSCSLSLSHLLFLVLPGLCPLPLVPSPTPLLSSPPFPCSHTLVPCYPSFLLALSPLPHLSSIPPVRIPLSSLHSPSGLDSQPSHPQTLTPNPRTLQPLYPSRRIQMALIQLFPIRPPFPFSASAIPIFPRCTISSYTNNRTSRAPLHAFPALRSLSLLLPVSHLDSLPHCSFLTPLALFNPHPSTLSSLASSSSAVRPILKTLNLKSAELTACLAPLASFPSLSSLDLQTCSIDPFELHALSRSLHTLTDLGIINCPLISSHSLATLAQTNLALSSLSLHTTSYHLFSAQGLWSLFHAPPAHLHTLSFSGLPSFRPGLLAHCSGLQSLTIAGRWEIAPRFSVRGCDDEAGQEMERMGWGFDDDWLTWGGSFGEVDLGEAAAAAAVPTQQVSLESLIESATDSIRSAIALCRSVQVAILDQAAATEREHAMIEAFSAAGVFVKRESRGGEGEGGAGLLEEIDGILLGNDVAGTGSDGDGAGDADGGGEREGEGAAGNVSPRATALGVIQTLMWQLGEERRNTYETFERMRWRVARGAAGWPAHEAGLAAAAGGILGGAAAAAAAASADAGAYLAASAPPLCIPSHVLHIFQSTLLILLCVSLPEPECPASDL
ncbi:unnamed protein product [Closterium sp. NIES-64]|nr:unnamed protein product [Closterium sp. NIES-64]